VPLLTAPARSGRERRVDWSLLAYSGGAGLVTAAVVALTARATAGIDEVVRLCVVLGAAVVTVGLAIDRAEQSLRAVRAVTMRAAGTFARAERND